jgi:hypothetical protein
MKPRCPSAAQNAPAATPAADQRKVRAIDNNERCFKGLDGHPGTGTNEFQAKPRKRINFVQFLRRAQAGPRQIDLPKE